MIEFKIGQPDMVLVCDIAKKLAHHNTMNMAAMITLLEMNPNIHVVEHVNDTITLELSIGDTVFHYTGVTLQHIKIEWWTVTLVCDFHNRIMRDSEIDG